MSGFKEIFIATSFAEDAKKFLIFPERLKMSK